MFCYRHPDREAFVTCQRCDRVICHDCQTEAAVGFVCPEHAGSGRPSKLKSVSATGSGMTVTYSIMAACVVIWLANLVLPAFYLLEQFYYVPIATNVEPWRMLTTGFVHDSTSIFHLLFNMWSLYVLGGMLEPVLGKGRFALLYVLSLFGGSLAVLYLASADTAVVGASGAIFGLMGALFVISKNLGSNTNQLLIVIALNLFMGFVISNIAWQAHVGGLAVGALVGWIYSTNRAASQQKRRQLLLAALSVVLVVAAFIGSQLMLTFNA